LSVLHIFGVFLLIGVNAFFSAVEFSLVTVRASRVRQLVEKGDSRARVVEHLISDITRVVSGVQVGITLSSLALGYLGEITLASILTPLVDQVRHPWASLVAHGAALAVAFSFLTVLQVVFGELVPKGLSLARAERIALLIARPFSWFLNTFSHAIDLLDGFAERIVNILGVASFHQHGQVRSSEELQVMVEQAEDRGVLPATEAQFIHNAMELTEVQVREIMVPRPDMHALPVEATLEETMRLFATTQRSRIPIYEGTLDHIVGFLHVKDMIWGLLERTRRAEEHLPPLPFHLKAIAREVLIVPETKLAGELLVEFRTKRTGLAMVVDEFGSILGLVTLEDILEQMVGEIHDEFDVVEAPFVSADGSMIFDAAIKLRDLDTQYGVALTDEGPYETIGGFVLNHLGVIPRGGEIFEADGYRITVLEMDRRRVSRVRIKPLPAPTPSPRPAESSDSLENAPEKARGK
jgi:putative hemolysin